MKPTVPLRFNAGNSEPVSQGPYYTSAGFNVFIGRRGVAVRGGDGGGPPPREKHGDRSRGGHGHWWGWLNFWVGKLCDIPTYLSYLILFVALVTCQSNSELSGTSWTRVIQKRSDHVLIRHGVPELL